MRSAVSACMLVSAVLTVGFPTAASAAEWVNGSYGSMPPPTITPNGGYEANGEPLFVCRASMNGGMHPGKIRNGFNGCNIGYGGREETVVSYQVFTGHGRWTTAQFGAIPQGMIQAGREANGQPLGVCRAQWSGGVHPGKIRNGFSGCNIGYGGREITVNVYEVLTN